MWALSSNTAWLVIMPNSRGMQPTVLALALALALVTQAPGNKLNFVNRQAVKALDTKIKGKGECTP